MGVGVTVGVSVAVGVGEANEPVDTVAGFDGGPRVALSMTGRIRYM